MDQNLKILIFSLNNENFSTDINQVERIIGYEEPTPLPETPNFVQGVIKYEDKIVPIINMNKKFGFVEKNDENKKIIIIKRDENKFGIIVDNVYEVKDVEESLLEEAPEITIGIGRKYIKGLIKLDEKIVILLDLDKILKKEEEESIF
ncbi:chemotaxis protein CheW [Clostridium thermobutyricum]|uniref:chemotaxis protein CheW n=1 Tax=uncultured Clostridium sp. TaxID=59620 RepID=UPI0018AAEB51|nr:chemotaxis protein CheW [Clostridium thermobutyricum]